MAGKNKILKPGDLLFRVGDASDGMYVLRKGQLQVFLDKGGTEIVLASVGAGGMIGEMSLFEKKPRSASARAVEETEVTQISNEDFTKILQQIPKWFVGLMTTLSSRLRDTNERLQELEGKYKGNINPLDELLKILQILQLLYYKSGVKDVKSWSLEREPAESELVLILNMEKAKITTLLDSIVLGGMLSVKKNEYKRDVLVIHNRGDLERFIDFLRRFRSKNKAAKALPQDFVEILEMLAKAAKVSAYDTFSVELRQLVMEATKLGVKTEGWPETALMLSDIDESVVVGKNKEPSFKITKKTIEIFLQHSRALRIITRSEAKDRPKAKPPASAA